ncbi:MAG: hypothetical protein JOY71_18155 [Acetobacteraceae bacterium]|nr:hypothetical protein [Acetobacteraceae bacterium]
MAILIHGNKPSTVFGLRGSDENSASLAVGWVLENSRTFRAILVEAVFGSASNVDGALITLQEHGEHDGYTDLEIRNRREFHAIIEAKRSWDVPTVGQLKRYVSRLLSSAAVQKKLISVSAADQRYALRRLPAELDGIRVGHLSWRELKGFAARAQSTASGFEEKFWLRQIIQHLEEFALMGRENDNKVYVVSLGSGAMIDGQTHTWIDVVENDGCYFHPVGNNWPTQPPNYVGFRYRGRLQSVHHIDSFEIVENLARSNPLWPETASDHFIYRLGPPMRPPCEVKTGNIFRNGRVWCAIDTLLSGAFTTISDARDETQRRIAAAGGSTGVPSREPLESTDRG